jgi:hypothetical protein
MPDRQVETAKIMLENFSPMAPYTVSKISAIWDGSCSTLFLSKNAISCSISLDK